MLAPNRSMVILCHKAVMENKIKVTNTEPLKYPILYGSVVSKTLDLLGDMTLQSFWVLLTIYYLHSPNAVSRSRNHGCRKWFQSQHDVPDPEPTMLDIIESKG